VVGSESPGEGGSEGRDGGRESGESLVEEGGDVESESDRSDVSVESSLNDEGSRSMFESLRVKEREGEEKGISESRVSKVEAVETKRETLTCSNFPASTGSSMGTNFFSCDICHEIIGGAGAHL